MGDTSENSAAAFVEHWARVGPMLERINREEQRRLSEEEHRAAVANVLSLADPQHGNGNTSGLVEQQLLFSQGRR